MALEHSHFLNGCVPLACCRERADESSTELPTCRVQCSKMLSILWTRACWGTPKVNSLLHKCTDAEHFKLLLGRRLLLKLCPRSLKL